MKKLLCAIAVAIIATGFSLSLPAAAMPVTLHTGDDVTGEEAFVAKVEGYANKISGAVKANDLDAAIDYTAKFSKMVESVGTGRFKFSDGQNQRLDLAMQKIKEAFDSFEGTVTIDRKLDFFEKIVNEMINGLNANDKEAINDAFTKMNIFADKFGDFEEEDLTPAQLQRAQATAKRLSDAFGTN